MHRIPFFVLLVVCFNATSMERETHGGLTEQQFLKDNVTHAFYIQSTNGRTYDEVTTSTNLIAFSGSSFEASGGYNFDGTSTYGPRLAPNVITDNTSYSLEMWFSLTTVPGGGEYKKLVDFKDRTSVNGVYASDGTVDFVGINGQEVGTTSISDGNLNQLILVRSGNDFNYWVNGVKQLGTDLNDAAGDAAFSNTDMPIQLLRADTTTTGEDPAGFLLRVRTYETELTQLHVDELYGTGDGASGFDPVAVPEPSTYLALSVLTLGIVGFQWRRRKLRKARAA